MINKKGVSKNAIIFIVFIVVLLVFSFAVQGVLKSNELKTANAVASPNNGYVGVYVVNPETDNNGGDFDE